MKTPKGRGSPSRLSRGAREQMRREGEARSPKRSILAEQHADGSIPERAHGTNTTSTRALSNLAGQEAVTAATIRTAAINDARHFPLNDTGEPRLPVGVKLHVTEIRGTVDLLNLPSYPASKLPNLQAMNGTVDQARIALNAVGTGQIADNAVGLLKLADSVKDQPQVTTSTRKIGSSLGGGSLQAAAADHSHGSGNTMDFDYLGDTNVTKVLSLRRRLREKRAVPVTVPGTVTRQEYRELLDMTLVLAHILFDAPDMTAEERLDKRRAGESYPEMFEWRREQDTEKGYLHNRSQKNYASPPLELQTLL